MRFKSKSLKKRDARVQFYGSGNKFFSFRITNINDAKAALARMSGYGIKAAWYVERNKEGLIIQNLRLR